MHAHDVCLVRRHAATTDVEERGADRIGPARAADRKPAVGPGNVARPRAREVVVEAVLAGGAHRSSPATSMKATDLRASESIASYATTSS